MPMTIPIRMFRMRRTNLAQPAMWLLLAMAMLLVSIPSNAVAQDASSPPFPERRSDTSLRVYDEAGVLTDSEENALQSDAVRAATLGIEILVYTRMTTDAEASSQQFADRLRHDWHVETSEGADNGIVFMLAVNPKGAKESHVVMSYGTHTFPLRQLTQDRFTEIVKNEMTPALEAGDFSTALYYGTRRMLNFREYSPPDQPAITRLQERVGVSTNVLAVLVLQAAVIGYLLIPVLSKRRLSWVVERKWLAVYAVVLGALAALVGIAAIYARDAFASITCLALLLWCGAIIPLLAKWLAPNGERSVDPLAVDGHSPGQIHA